MNTIGMSVYLLLLLTAAAFAEFETPVPESQDTLNGTSLPIPVPPQDSRSHKEDAQVCTDKSPSVMYDVTPGDQFIEALDCSDMLKHGRASSGVYAIRPKDFSEPFKVYCDMEKDNGGWTVIQRRGYYGTPDDYFVKNWDEYKRGFGDLTGEFYLENDKISALTSQGKYRLKIDLILTNWTFADLTYRTFKVDNELEFYKLNVGKFSTPGQVDDMSYHNGQRFSTKDRNNGPLNQSCGEDYKSGWWYKACYNINLNGIRSLDNSKNEVTFGNPVLHLRNVVMKIRLDDF